MHYLGPIFTQHENKVFSIHSLPLNTIVFGAHKMIHKNQVFFNTLPPTKHYCVWCMYNMTGGAITNL